MTKLAEQLSALWAYRNTPDHAPEPVASSFVTVPANDNGMVAKTERLQGEKLLKVTPSIEEIMRNMAKEWVWKEGRLVSIGSLKFADGKTHHEKVWSRVEAGVVKLVSRRMPQGAMLGCTESLTEDAGSQSMNITIGNATLLRNHFPKTGSGEAIPYRDYIPSGVRRKGRSFTAAQSRALIAEAIANTSVMPPVTKCPPGMANGTAQHSDQFIGMKIGSTGKGGLIHWVDLFVAGEDHRAWIAAVESLDGSDRDTLDLTLTADSMAAMGKSGHRRTRERQAVKRLKAANDNYLSAVKAFSA